MNNGYFRNLKKTGPPVETGRPLRLLDMRLFNCLGCAVATAWNGKNLTIYYLFFPPVVTVTHSITKHTQSVKGNPNNLLPEILSLTCYF